MTTDLVQYNGQPPVRRTDTALEIDADLTFEEWETIGKTLGEAGRAWQWWVGDWVTYGETAGYVSREKYQRAEDITGLRHSTLWEYAMVARRFDSLDRSKELPFTHHARIARIPDHEKRMEILAAAEEGRWSTREIDRYITPTPTRQNVMPQKRHAALIEGAASLVRLGERWEREMTDALAPPQARKQLTVLRKAHNLLGEVIEAVEYRAATLHTWHGH